MRRGDISQPSPFTTCTVEDFVLANSPFCALRKLVDEALLDLHAPFIRPHVDEDRASAVPECLIDALRWWRPTRNAECCGWWN